MNRIKELRQEKAMTQEELGRYLNVQNTTISMYEREERQMSPPTVDRMCNLFECSADYLLGRSTIREPTITEEENLIIRAYRGMPEKDRKIIKLLVSDFLENEQDRLQKRPK